VTSIFADHTAGVTRLDEQAVQRELNANVPSAGKPNVYLMQILERNALSQRYKEEPEAVRVELNSGLGKVDERDRLFGGTGQEEFW
jgi:hypothetical protein